MLKMTYFMNRLLILLPAVLLGFMLVGCESVASLHPVGNSIVKINVQDWQGSWVDKEGNVLHTKVINPEAGEFLLIIINLDSQVDEKLVEKYPVTVRHTGDNYYFNMLQNENGKDNYYFAKFDRHADNITVYTPGYDYYANSINTHQVNGSVNTETYSVILDGDAAQINAYIESHTDGFKTTEPYVLRKLGKQ